MRDETVSWNEEFGARFKKISDKDAEIWERIIREELPSARADDIRDAMCVLVERKRKGEIDYSPTVEDMIRAIKYNWWKKKQARDGLNPDDECMMCSGGWLSYCYSTVNGEKHLGVVPPVEIPATESCPCLCSKGQKKLAERFPMEKHEEIREWAKLVMEWINNITEESHGEEQPFMRNNK